MNSPNKPDEFLSFLNSQSATNVGQGDKFQHDAYNQVGNPISGYAPEVVTANMDVDDAIAKRQTTLDKAANGIIKMGGLAGTTGVGVFTSLPLGLLGTLGKATYRALDPNTEFTSQDLSYIYDNEISRTLDSFNRTLEARFPNYETQEEKEASALSPTNIFSANMVFGKIVKNAGYTIGSIRSGRAFAPLFQSLGKAAFGGGAGVEAIALAEQGVGQGAKLAAALPQALKSIKLTNAAAQLGATTLAAMSEATAEGLGAKQESLKSLTEQFVQEKGRNPLPFEQDRLQEQASAVGNVTTAWNMPLLMLSDTFQFGKYLGGGWKNSTKLGVKAPTKWGVLAGEALSYGKNALMEAGEEGSQTFITSAAKSYYQRKNDPNATLDVDSLGEAALDGLTEVFGTKDGLESMLLGAVTGTASHGVMSLVNKYQGNPGAFAQAQANFEASQQAAAQFQQYGETSGLFKLREGAIRHASIQGDMDQALQAGDVYAYQNLRADHLKNMVQTHSNVGRFSLLMDKLEDLKSLPEEEFQEAFNLDPDVAGQKTVAQYVDSLKAEARTLKKTLENVQERFPGASDAQQSALYDVLTNISNRSKREQEINTKVFQATGVEYIAWSGLNPGVPVEEYGKQVLESLTENPGSLEVTAQEILDFVRLKQEREQLVATYQSLISGGLKDVVEPTPQPKVEPKPQVHTTPVQPQTDPITGIPQVQEEEPPMEEAGDPGEEIPAVQTPQPSQQPQTPEVVQPSSQATKQAPVANSKAQEMAQLLHSKGVSPEEVEKGTESDGVVNALGRKGSVLDRDPALRAQVQEALQALSSSVIQDPTPEAIPTLNPVEESEVTPTPIPQTPEPTRDLKADPSYYTKSVMYMGHQLKEGYEYPASEEKFRVLHQETLPKLRSGEYSLKGAHYYVKAEEGATKASTHYNLYTTLNGQETFLGFLQQDIKNSQGSPEQKAANEQAIQLLAQVKHKARQQYGVATPLDVQVSASLDSLSPGEVGEKLSSDLIPAATTYGGKHTILRQKRGKEQSTEGTYFNREITYLSGGKEVGQKYLTPQFIQDFGQDAPTDGFLLVVPTLDGKGKKLVGLTTAPASPQTFAKLGTKFTKGEVPAFLAANQSTSLGNIHTQLRWNSKGLVVQVNRNEENEDLGVLFVDTSKPITSQAEFLKALTPNEKLAENLGKLKVKDLFSENPVREEPGEFPTPSSFTLSTTPQVWGPIYFNVTGIQTSVVTPVSEEPASRFVDTSKYFTGSIEDGKGKFRLTSPETGTAFKEAVQTHITSLLPGAVIGGGINIQGGEMSLNVDYKGVRYPLEDITIASGSGGTIKGREISLVQYTNQIKEDAATREQTSNPTPNTSPSTETPQEKAQRRAREAAERQKAREQAGEIALKRQKAREQAGEIALKIRAQGKVKQSTLTTTDFQRARKNLAKLLPSSYSLSHIDQLLNGVYADGGTWGAYKNKVVYLFSKAPKGTEFHEAFHAVYRDLLPKDLKTKVDKQMASLMGESLSMAGIEGFRQAYGSRYDSYSNREIADLMVEEALADHFQDYMNSRSGVKGVFRKAFDLIRDFFRLLTGRKGQEIDTLFAAIESGKYRSAQPSLNKGGEAPVWSLPTTLASGAKSKELVGKLFHQYIDRYQAYTGSPSERFAQMVEALRIEESILDTQGLADNPEWLQANRKEVEVDENTGEDYLVDLGLMEEAIPYLWKEVQANLKALNLKPTEQALELPLDSLDKQDRVDDLEDEEGQDINDTKERSFDANSFTLTGIGSLSQQLKSFLSLLATPIPGSNFKLPANVFGTFSLLQRNLKGLDTFEEMKARLESLAQSDPTGVLTDLVTRLDAKLQAKEVDQYFINKFTRTFKTEVLNSLFTELDQDKGTARVYSANRNKEEDMLVNRWEKQYNSLLSKGANLKGLAAAVKGFLDQVEAKHQEGTPFTLQEAQDGAFNLASVGLDFSPGFLHEVFQGTSPLDIPTLSRELSQVLSFMAQGKNPFGEAKSRLTSLAKQDVLFRADIYQASYQNAKGETVYGHTAPSFEYVRARKLQDGTHDLDFNSPYYSRNYLVQHHTQGNQVKGEKMGLLQVAGGLRERSQEEGVTPKQIDPRTQILNDLALYSQQGAFRWAVHEAKATTTLVVLGAIDGVPNMDTFVDQDGITPQGKAALLDMVHQDQLKQGKVMKELYGQPHQGKLPSTELVGGYHFLEKAPKSAPKDLPLLPGGFTNGQPNTIPKALATQYIEAGYRNLLPTGFQYSQFPDLNSSKDVPTEKELDTFLDVFLDKATQEFNDLLQSKDLGQPQHMKLLAGEAWVKDHSQFPVEDARVWKQNFLLQDLVVSNAMSQLVAGEEAFYLNHTNKTKRMAGAIASGQDLGEGSFVAAVLADEESTITPTTFGEGTQEKFVGEKVNATDAQSYVSPARFQFIKKQLGYSSPQTDALITKLIQGQKLTQKESDKVMEELTANPIKGVYFDGQTYIKTSYFPLFKELTSTHEDGKWVPIPGREKLHHLREVLEGEQDGARDTSLPVLDELHRVSASKLQRKGVNFPTSNGNFDRGTLATQTLENRYWRLQVENPSGKTKITQGTQLMQLLDSEMPDDHDVIYQGKTAKVGEVRKAYQGAMAKNKVKAFTKASKVLDAVVNGDSVYLEMVQDLMKESGATQNQVDFFTQAAGQPKYSLDLPFLEQQVEKAFLSFFNKQVFQQKVPGMKLTLVSSSGFQVVDEVTGQPRDLKIHRLENGKVQLAEVILSEELLRKKGMTLEEYQTLSLEDQAKLTTMLGFRIPTQSHHSMMPFKVVDWIPAYYGSSVVAPKEITWLSGADYDVDSLFVNRKEFRVLRGDNGEFLGMSIPGEETSMKDQYENWKDYTQTQDTYYKFLTHKKGMSPEEAFTQMGLPLSLEVFQALPKEDRVTGHALSNQRFDGELAFITNPSNVESLFTPASIDSLKFLKGFANGVYGVSEDNTMPYHSYATRSLQWEATTTGKANVGGAANAGKTHAWLAKNEVSLSTPLTFSGVESTGFQHLDQGDVNLTREGGKWTIGETLSPSRIADQLSTMTSGMTDDAKERLSFALNLTPSTLPVFEYAISLGLGINRVLGLFATQPILKELAYRQQQADAQVKDKGVSSFELTKKLLAQMEARVQPVYGGGVMDSHLLETLQDAQGNLSKAQNLTRNGVAEEEDLPFLRGQAAILMLYSQLEEQAKYFGYVNKLLNSNKGLPVSVQEAKDYFVTPELALRSEKSPFSVSEALNRESNIQTNLNLILPSQGGKSVLDQTQKRFLVDSPLFNSLKETFQGLGGRNTQLQDFQMGFLTHLTMLVENQQVLNTTGKSLSEYQYLLTSPERNITQTLAFLMAQEGLQDNLFLNQLIPKSPDKDGKGSNPFYRLEYNTRAKNEADFVDQLSAEWLDLYSHPNPKVVEAAKELRVYLSIKDSLQFKNQSFVSLAKPNLFHNLSNGFSEGGKKIVGLKEVSDLIKQGKVDQAAAKLGVTLDQLTQDFWTKWYSIPENTKGLESWFGKNKKYSETFGKYAPLPGSKDVVVVKAGDEVTQSFPVAFSEGGQTVEDGDGSYTTPKVAYVLSKVDGKTAFYTKVAQDPTGKYQAPWAKGIVQPLIFPQEVETPQEEVREESGAPDLQKANLLTSFFLQTSLLNQAQESDLTC
ncbi:hypothetical protein Q5H92_14810 [Hymenobacter sp. M29]|uniref:Large polyvalent protein associated domain-containing protein n=1 Tax=Hymenobacter mellowenesis TaxID=3063995 RepID=A0ABT9ADZ9_9BACT|nr:hypothetical protein [Hymenobacter sp. M29]MDO7847637.1 hypothetical protein [Hymenobacter sp. M29]